MFKKCYVIILPVLLFVACSFSYAQSGIDTLRQKIQQTTGAERAGFLIEFTAKTWRSDPAMGIRYADEAIEIAQRLNEYELEAKALEQRALIFSIQDSHFVALEDYLAALEINRSLGSKSGEADILHGLGNLYLDQGNYRKALDYYFQSLRLKEDLEDNVSRAHTLTFIGVVHERREEWESAIEFYLQALSLSEEAKDFKEIAITSGQAANALQKTGRSEEAIAVFKKALDAADRLGSSHAKATILLDMSRLYQSQKAYEDAIRVNKQEVESARQTGSLFLEAQGLENMGGIYSEMGNAAKAIKYLEAARSIFDTLNIGESAIRTRIQLARTHLNSSNYEEAVTFARQALERAGKETPYEVRFTILQVLNEVQIKQGNYQEVIRIQNELLALKDSAYSREQEQQISEMRTRYETQQKEREIALLQKENEREVLVRNAFAGGSLLVIIIGFLIYNRQRLKINKNKTELENTRLKEQQLKQDLDFKNKQLTTHTLNLIQKNELMKELKEEIQGIKESPEHGIDKKMNNLEHLVNYSFNLDKDWKEFKLYFEEIHIGFFDVLKSKFPDLTPNELRLSALVKLNLTIKEIATIMNIAPDSVKTARYRLRKKLDMETGENLMEFLMNVEENG